MTLALYCPPIIKGNANFTSIQVSALGPLLVNGTCLSGYYKNAPGGPPSMFCNPNGTWNPTMINPSVSRQTSSGYSGA